MVGALRRYESGGVCVPNDGRILMACLVTPRSVIALGVSQLL